MIDQEIARDEVAVREAGHDRSGRELQCLGRKPPHSGDVNDVGRIPLRVVEPPIESPEERFNRTCATSGGTFGRWNVAADSDRSDSRCQVAGN